MEFNPAPKPNHNRRIPKQKDRSRFPEAVKELIFERDNFTCVRCQTSQNLESVPHHIIFRSQGGEGTLRNGCCICRACHMAAHASKKEREWFVSWMELNLDEDGFMKYPIAKNPDL